MNTKLDFINGNTKKCLLAMTLPMIVAMFLNMAYNLVDSLWIGNLLGELAYDSTSEKLNTYRTTFDFCCDGSNKWNFYFALAGNRS